MNLIPNVLATITLITISYGYMQSISDKFSKNQPMIRKKSVQRMAEMENKSITDTHITKTKSLQQQGFKKDDHFSTL